MKQRFLICRAGVTGSVLLSLLVFATQLAAQVPEARAAEYLDQLWRATGVPSITVAVAHQQRIVFSEGIGFADLDNLVPASPSTVYNVGSISKVMAAVAVMQLVEQGKIGLGDPIRKYVPGFPDKGTPITLRHLMTHTSGIRHYRPFDFPRGLEWDNVATFDSLDEAIELFKDDPLLFAPGAYFFYTSYGVNLLQGVIEATTEMPFERYMRRYVWGPAGMLASAFDHPERIVPGRARSYRLVDERTVNYYPNENVTYKFASGGMISTAEDLVRFGMALDGGRLLNPKTVDLMFTPQLKNVLSFEGENPASPLRWDQALMWRIRNDDSGRPYVNHCGSVKGYNACLILYVEEGLVVAVMENGGGAGPAIREALVFADFFREAPARN